MLDFNNNIEKLCTVCNREMLQRAGRSLLERTLNWESIFIGKSFVSISFTLVIRALPSIILGLYRYTWYIPV